MRGRGLVGRGRVCVARRARAARQLQLVLVLQSRGAEPGRGGGGGAGRGVSAVLAVRGAGEVVCAVLPPLSSPPDQMNLMTEEEGLGAGVLARLPTERSM